jgi:quercetin dioxygenase-like cupin family protein
MPIFRPTDAVTYEIHGSRFRSFVAPSRGSEQLCSWELTVPAGNKGVAHRPNREEVLLIQSGQLRVTLDGTASDLQAGDVVLVPANTELQIDGGAETATAWVTTTPGLAAATADGNVITPPWAN